MRSTSFTRKAWAWPQNSVMIIFEAVPSDMPRNSPRSITGMIAPRRDTSPLTPAGMRGATVIGITSQTSRTLNTLMP